MPINALDTVAKTCIRLLLKEPFYGHYMSGVPKQMTDQVPTAAVALFNNQLIKLQVNPEFWEGLSDPHRYGLIKHEVLHIVLDHLLQSRKFSNKRLYNIAADIVVNQYISPEQLPEGGITLKRFAYLERTHNLRLAPNMDTGYYYRKLDGLLKENPQPLLSPNEEGRTGGEGNFLFDLLQNSNSELDRHAAWKEVDQLSPGDAKIMEHQLNSALKNTVSRIEKSSNGYGTMPRGLVEKLKAKLKGLQAKFDWRRMLRLFAASSNSTYIKNTLRRPSKRYGTSPGIKLNRRQKLLLAVDTSGSVPLSDLEIFFSEIYHIWRQGADITVVECDAEIQKTYKYRGQLPQQVHGRGGTNFTPPIEFANNDLHPDAVIYFTDGFAPPPAVKSRYPILWVMSTNGLDKSNPMWEKLPGQKIRIN